MCKNLHNFQHRPQAKPQRKASEPNWKSKVPGPQPMLKFWILNRCVKILTFSNTGLRPSPRRRHQGQVGKVGCQAHSQFGIYCFKTLVEKMLEIQHRPQTKPQRKASGPNWKSKVPGPQPMWKFWFSNRCVKICTISNTGPRPSPKRRHQGQLGKVRRQAHCQ